MAAPRKYDDETRDRAIRLYQDRRRDYPEESLLQARRRVGELLDIPQDTLRGWIERKEIDALRPLGWLTPCLGISSPRSPDLRMRSTLESRGARPGF